MPRGGSRAGAGRKATGLTTAVISMRIPVDLANTIKARAFENHLSISAFLMPILLNQFKPRRSRHARRP